MGISGRGIAAPFQRVGQQAGQRAGQSVAGALGAARANPTLAAIAAEGFLTRLGFGMVGFALPLYALALGMGLGEVGLLYALRTATTFLVKPLMGWAADRFGRKSTLVVAVALRCLVGLLFVFAYLPWHLYAIRVLHGAMTAARDPSATALLAEHGERRRLASTYAWYTTARDLGRSLGYAAAGLLIQLTGSYRVSFFVAFVASCAALVTVIRYVRESREGAVGAAPSAGSAGEPAGAEKQAWAPYLRLLPYAGFGLTVAGSAEMMRGLFPVIATQYAHLTEGQAGVAASASTLAILLAGPLFGWLSDHVSPRLALGARSVANVVSSALYVVLPSFGGFVAARVLDDVGKAAFRPTWAATLAHVSAADPARRARLLTFVDSASTAGEVVGPLVAALVMAAAGVPAMLGLRALLAVVAELQAVRLFGAGHGGELAADAAPPRASAGTSRSAPAPLHQASG